MMMKNFRKGQAALEFLTTYGWAFLVILVMIGALGYFGILSPGNFLPQRCNVGPEFSCDEYQVTQPGGQGSPANMSIIFRSNIGEAFRINVSDVNASFGEVPHSNNCWIGDSESDLDNADGAEKTIGAGGELWVVCQFPGGSFPPVGDKVRFDLRTSYTPVGGQFQRPITAELFATLQE